MESNRKFTLIVFNTCTQEYEEVIVTEEVYRAYCRTRWNIKDNDQSFFDHEIQTSGMIGSQDGAYENFREFIDAINTPEHIILEQIKKEALYQAISALPAADQALVQGLFFKGQSELDYGWNKGDTCVMITNKAKRSTSEYIVESYDGVYFGIRSHTGLYHRVSPWRMFRTKEEAIETLAEQKYGGISL